MGFYPANFGLPRSFRSRVRSMHATDRRTDEQTDTAPHFIMPLPYGDRGHSNTVAQKKIPKLTKSKLTGSCKNVLQLLCCKWPGSGSQIWGSVPCTAIGALLLLVLQLSSVTDSNDRRLFYNVMNARYTTTQPYGCCQDVMSQQLECTTHIITPLPFTMAGACE